MITLATELAHIRGPNQKLIDRLGKLNIRTVENLLRHFPSRYEDFSARSSIAELQLNQTATIHGVIKRVTTRRTWRKHMILVEATIADETGSVKAIWFNQPFLARILRPGSEANFAGKVLANEEDVYLSNPIYEFVGRAGFLRESSHTARLVPVYPETRGLTSRGIRYLIKPLLRAVGVIPDFVPEDVRRAHGLPALAEAIRHIHFPETLRETERARARFAFDELFLLQISNMKRRRLLRRERSIPIQTNAEELRELTQALPFRLTPSQENSLREIMGDLSRRHPMNRLLQGDVGSGKTAVAALAALIAARRGAQTAFMAPTEVLARQHYRTFTEIMGRIAEDKSTSAALLLSGEARICYGKNLEERITKQKLLGLIESEAVSIVIGTHALIQKNVFFAKLALVVVDEQHRFGVQQRAQLTARKRTPSSPPGVSAPLPHFLSMSATPIPRTLSLTLFGDLDLSTITELPAGRKQIITKIVAPENRGKAYAFIREQVRNGRQAFVICPRIDPVEEHHEETADAAPQGSLPLPREQMLRDEVKAVKEEYEKLSKEVFPDCRVGMLHGKLKSREKETVMAAFSAGTIDVLVATSVVEVGVDVPNANIMVVEGADHFGLSQLYQFRGRIGRGLHQSFCLLFTHADHPATPVRLRTLLAAKNGFELAEQDLALRGPGQFLGERQTGLPDLAMRSLQNILLIKTARAAAEFVVAKDPALATYPALREKLASFENQVHLE